MQNRLPPETARVWQRLESEPLLAGWYLIGGSALALRIGHRQSEDLLLVENAPPVEEIAAFFRDEVRQWKERRAANALAGKSGNAEATNGRQAS